MQRRYTYPKTHRLRHELEFKAVYDAKVRGVARAAECVCDSQ